MNVQSLCRNGFKFLVHCSTLKPNKDTGTECAPSKYLSNKLNDGCVKGHFTHSNLSL